MTKDKISMCVSELLNYVNAPEFVPKFKNLDEEHNLHSVRKDKIDVCSQESSSWVKAPEFVPKISNLHAKIQSLRKDKTSTSCRDSTKWATAPEFVPRTKCFNHPSFSVKDKTTTNYPDSTNWVKAPEFVPHTNKVSYKKPIFNSITKDKKQICGLDLPNWVNAPEFVPRVKKSFADILKSNICGTKSKPQKLDMELCTHFFEGVCLYNGDCPCIHGDFCELCHKYCLNPFDERKRKYHIEYCEKQLEQDMELSFAIQRSLDKACGICMDIIIEKNPATERRFGILEKCNHVFCLSCIRKWRSLKTFENNQSPNNVTNPVVNRSCPECRISSGFIIPSQYWVDAEDEKKKLIAEYKNALGKTHCKYFKRGKGTCPFGGACFYLHAKPDGTKVDLPLPSRRRRHNQNGEFNFMGTITLWDYLEARDQINRIESR